MKRRAGGFTLVELIVGLTVAMLAVTAGMAALATVQDRGAHAESATREAAAGAAQRAQLVEWLAGARQAAPNGVTFEGAEYDVSGRLVNLLVVPTTARTPLGGPITVIGLYVDEDADTPERGLVAELAGMAAGIETRRIELVPSAVRMHVRYLARGSTFGEWEDTWSGRNELPRLVELTLEAAPGDSLPRLLRYPIRVAPAEGL